MKVFVYWNLHRKMWSVKALEGESKGKVIAHCGHLRLTDAQFKVSEAGRQRVIRTGRKSVHAGVVGQTLANAPEYKGLLWEEPIRYNPRTGPDFVLVTNGQPIHTAPFVEFNPNRRLAAFGNGDVQ